MRPDISVGVAGVCAALALAVSGCGGSGATVTSTATHTTTSAPPATGTASHAPSANPNHGRDYPASFTTSFVRSCDKRASATRCECALAYIKAHATYAQVVKDVLAGNFIDGPVYQASILTCISR